MGIGQTPRGSSRVPETSRSPTSVQEGVCRSGRYAPPRARPCREGREHRVDLRVLPHRCVPKPVTDSGDERPILGHGQRLRQSAGSRCCRWSGRSASTTVLTIGGARRLWRVTRNTCLTPSFAPNVGGMYVGPAVSVGSPAQQDGRSSAARTACRLNGIAARSRASGRTPRTAWATHCRRRQSTDLHRSGIIPR
jgi:hypothetical protein